MPSSASISRRTGLRASAGVVGSLVLPKEGGADSKGRPLSRAKAGLLITGQSNAGFFLADGGTWILNKGLSSLLGIAEADFDPRLNGFRTIGGYALGEGAHNNPSMATTFGGTPLWAPGDEGAFLTHRSGTDPSRWQPGSTGRSLDRFVRDLLTARDRAECLGILWIHTENDSQTKRTGDTATHAAAIRRHLALIRAAFGRPASGPDELPAYGWAPIPYGNSAEGHRTVRAALAAVIADPTQNFRLAMPQTGDSEARDGKDWSHRDAADLRIFARRAAYAVARHQRERHGLGTAALPGPGPRISLIRAESPTSTLVTVQHDRGRRLKASAAAHDGRGWSIFDRGEQRAVTAMELKTADQILIRHEACTGDLQRRSLGYCLNGEQVGRGNAVTDDWSRHASSIPGLDQEWQIDFPLQASLLPIGT